MSRRATCLFYLNRINYNFHQGLAGSPYQPEHPGLDQNGKLTGKYGETQQGQLLSCTFSAFNLSSLCGCKPRRWRWRAPQPLGFGSETKSSEFCLHQSFFPAAFKCLLNGHWFHLDNQGPYQAQLIEAAAEGRPGEEYGIFFITVANERVWSEMYNQFFTHPFVSSQLQLLYLMNPCLLNRIPLKIPTVCSLCFWRHSQHKYIVESTLQCFFLLLASQWRERYQLQHLQLKARGCPLILTVSKVCISAWLSAFRIQVMFNSVSFTENVGYINGQVQPEGKIRNIHFIP